MVWDRMINSVCIQYYSQSLNDLIQVQNKSPRGLGAFFDSMPDDIIIEIMLLTCPSGHEYLQHGDELKAMGRCGMSIIPSSWFLLCRGFRHLATTTSHLYKSILVVLDEDPGRPARIDNEFDVKQALKFGGNDLPLSLVVDFRGPGGCPRHTFRGHRPHCLTCVPWIEGSPCSTPSCLDLQGLLEEVGARTQSICFPIAGACGRLLDPSPLLWPLLEEVSAYGRQCPAPALLSSGIWRAPSLKRVDYLGFREMSSGGVSMGEHVSWEGIEKATIAEAVAIPAEEGDEPNGIYLADTARSVLTKGTDLKALEVVVVDQFPDIMRRMGLEGEATDDPVHCRLENGKDFAPLVHTGLRELVVHCTEAYWNGGPPSFFSHLSLPNLSYLEVCATSPLSRESMTELLDFCRICIGSLTVLDVTGTEVVHDDLVPLLRQAPQLEVLGLGCHSRLWPWDLTSMDVRVEDIPGRLIAHDCKGNHICDRFLEQLNSKEGSVCPKLREIRFLDPHVTVEGIKSFLSGRKGVIQIAELRCWAAVDAYGFGAFQKLIRSELDIGVVGTSFVVSKRVRPMKHPWSGSWIWQVRQAHWEKGARAGCESPPLSCPLSLDMSKGWILDGVEEGMGGVYDAEARIPLGGRTIPEGNDDGGWGTVTNTGWGSD